MLKLGFSVCFLDVDFWFCMVFRALFDLVLWCGSTWFVVRFNVAKREVCACCRALWEEKFQKKKGHFPYTFFYYVRWSKAVLHVDDWLAGFSVIIKLDIRRQVVGILFLRFLACTDAFCV